MKFSLIDTRTENDIYCQLLEYAKSYLPEWNGQGENEPGIILAKIYASLFTDTLSSYNKMLYKNYIYFLNMLGAKRQDGASAWGYASVKLNSVDFKGVYIKKGTRLYKQTENDRIIYETIDDVFAVDNEITEIYCCHRDNSIIVRPYSNRDTEQKGFQLFNFEDYENFQSIQLFLSNENIFYVSKGSEIIITVKNKEKPYLENKTAAYLGDSGKVSWSFIYKNGNREITNVYVIGNQIVLKLEHETEKSVAFQKESIWLVCEMKSNRGDLEKNSLEEVSFTELQYRSKCKNIIPIVYNNETQLIADELESYLPFILPFGEKFTEYDEFLINCDEAFCKNGATINISFEIYFKNIEKEEIKIEKKIKWKPIMRQDQVTEPPKEPITIVSVVWEYWNGKGWARLFGDARYQNVFSGGDRRLVTITFQCPFDTHEIIIGANSGRWIRARITKVGNIYTNSGVYRVPLINNILIDYAYTNSSIEDTYNEIFINENLETYKAVLGKETIKLFSSLNSTQQAAYFLLLKPIEGSPAKIYFKTGGEEVKNTTSLRWEYFGIVNNERKWIELKVLDKTKHLSQSGIITFRFSRPFEKLKMFSKEGYWLRAINISNGHETSHPAKIKEIYFNTIPIEQKESMEHEYFFISQGEKNKQCRLSRENITDCKVWVDESSLLLADELYYIDNHFISEIDTIIERDPLGEIIHLWRLWAETDSFLEWGENDRVYRASKQEGIIYFGNGANGKITFSSK